MTPRGSLIGGTSVLFATALSACSSDSSLTIRNDSSATLIEINLSPTDQSSWGPDLLGSDVLEPGDTLEIDDIECGDYDIRVVDETDSDCTLTAIELCFDEAVWAITDVDLAICDFESGGGGDGGDGGGDDGGDGDGGDGDDGGDGGDGGGDGGDGGGGDDGGDDGGDGDACDGYYECIDGTCIDPSAECDGEYDCAGGEDEDPDVCGSAGCEADEFTCDDGTCVPGLAQCDGRYDCRDLSDEAGC